MLDLAKVNLNKLRIPEGFRFQQLPWERIVELYRYDQGNQQNTSFLAGIAEGLGAMMWDHEETTALSTDGARTKEILTKSKPGLFTITIFPEIIRNIKLGLVEFRTKGEAAQTPLSGAAFLEILINADQKDPGLPGYKIADANTEDYFYGFLNRMISEFGDAVQRSRTGAAKAP